MSAVLEYYSALPRVFFHDACMHMYTCRPALTHMVDNPHAHEHFCSPHVHSCTHTHTQIYTDTHCTHTHTHTHLTVNVNRSFLAAAQQEKRREREALESGLMFSRDRLVEAVAVSNSCSKYGAVVLCSVSRVQITHL